MKKLMILGASELQLPAILQAKKMGIQSVVVDYNTKAAGVPYADVFFPISTLDEKGILQIAEDCHIDGIMTLASDRPMTVVAKVASALNLSGIDCDTAYRATNKIAMRKAMQEHCVPIPQFYVASNHDEFIQASRCFSSRFIVKPADNSGSRGVILADRSMDLEEVYRYSKLNSISGDVILEDYMEGAEVSVESFTINGETTVIGITDKITTGSPHFVEMGHTVQSRLSKKVKDKIKQVTSDTIDSIGIKNGPSHTEIKITNEGPKVVEIGARLGGDNIATKLVPLATGIDMVRLSILSALGEPFVIPEIENHAAAIRYFKAPKGRTVKKIKNVNQARSVPGVTDVIFHIEEGDTIPDILSSNDRIGYVIAKGNDPEEAIVYCEQALQIIEVQVGK